MAWAHAARMVEELHGSGTDAVAAADGVSLCKTVRQRVKEAVAANLASIYALKGRDLHARRLSAPRLVFHECVHDYFNVASGGNSNETLDPVFPVAGTLLTKIYRMTASHWIDDDDKGAAYNLNVCGIALRITGADRPVDSYASFVEQHARSVGEAVHEAFDGGPQLRLSYLWIVSDEDVAVVDASGREVAMALDGENLAIDDALDLREHVFEALGQRAKVRRGRAAVVPQAWNGNALVVNEYFQAMRRLEACCYLNEFLFYRSPPNQL